MAENAADTLGDVFVRVGVDAGGMLSGLASAFSGALKLATGFGSMLFKAISLPFELVGSVFRGFYNVFSSLMAGLFVPMNYLLAEGQKLWGLFAFKAMIDSSAEFDKAMKRATASMAGVQGNEEALRDTAKRVAREAGVSHLDVAAAYEAMAKNGFNAEQSMMAMATAAQYAKITDSNLAEATNELAHSMRVLGLMSEDATTNMRNMEWAGNLVAQSAKLGGTTVDIMGKALGSTVDSMEEFGQDARDVMAAVIGLTKSGKEMGSEAGPKLAMMFRMLSADSKRLAEQGIVVTDAWGEMKELPEVIDIFARRYGMLGQAAAIYQMKQAGLRAQTALFIWKLIETRKAADAARGSLDDVSGAMEEQATKRSGTLQRALVRLQETFWGLAESIGGPIAQAMIPMFDWMREKVDALRPVIETFMAQVRARAEYWGLLLTTTISGIARGIGGLLPDVLKNLFDPATIREGGAGLLDTFTRVLEIVATISNNWKLGWELMKMYASEAISNIRDKLLGIWEGRNQEGSFLSTVTKVFVFIKDRAIEFLEWLTKALISIVAPVGRAIAQWFAVNLGPDTLLGGMFMKAAGYEAKYELPGEYRGDRGERWVTKEKFEQIQPTAPGKYLPGTFMAPLGQPRWFKKPETGLELPPLTFGGNFARDVGLGLGEGLGRAPLSLFENVPLAVEDAWLAQQAAQAAALRKSAELTEAPLAGGRRVGTPGDVTLAGKVGFAGIAEMWKQTQLELMKGGMGPEERTAKGVETLVETAKSIELKLTPEGAFAARKEAAKELGLPVPLGTVSSQNPG